MTYFILGFMFGLFISFLLFIRWLLIQQDDYDLESSFSKDNH